MRKIRTQIEKISMETLVVVSVILILTTSTAVLMKKPLAWILEVILSVWLFFSIAVTIIKKREK